VSAHDATRALIAQQLGFSIGLRGDRGELYRDAAGTALEGEWLGGFAQPGVILNRVTAVSARFDAGTGAMIDEYGESTLVRQPHRGERVAFAKRYGKADPTARARFDYTGKLRGGELAGFWSYSLRPEFCGVFWLIRADHLDEPTLAGFRRRVRKTSPRRTAVKVVAASMAVAPLVSLGSPAVFAGVLAIDVAAIGVLRYRTARLARLVRGWRTELG
jgi:hypothetical protein